MTNRPRILMDCDPGIDDAFALFCALRFADLVAITTVNGNVSIDNTTRNARYLVELAGAHTPVHRGASRPLEFPAFSAADIHGVSGLGELHVPEAIAGEAEPPAVEAILDFCRDGGATIVATGPLTNVARAILQDPTVAERIDHLHWMGGSTTVGNVTDRAEFNAWADPHAVKVTLQSSVPMTMYGLNLTHQVRMDGSHIDELDSAKTATSSIMADLLGFYARNGVANPEGQPVHDTCAVLGLTHPELFQTAESNIVAHVTDDDRRGMTQVANEQPAASTITVAETVNAPAIIELVLLAACSPNPMGGS